MMPGGTLSNSLHHRSTKRTANRRRRRTAVLGVSVGVLAGTFASSGAAPIFAAPVALPAQAAPAISVGLRQGQSGPEVKALQNRTRRCRHLARRRSRWRVRPRDESRCGELPERPRPAGDRRGRCRDARGPDAGCRPSRERRHRRVGARRAGRRSQGTPAVIDAAGGFVPGGPDGVFGAATEKAVKSFQRWNGLELTGDRQCGNHGETGHDGGGRARCRASRARRHRRPESFGRAEDRRAGHARQVVAAGIDQQRDHHSRRSRRLVRRRHQSCPHRLSGRQWAHRLGHRRRGDRGETRPGCRRRGAGRTRRQQAIRTSG